MIGRSIPAMLALWTLWAAPACGQVTPQVTVGSKSFTESVILGEIVRQLAEHEGAAADHRKQLGGTRV